MKRGSSRSVAVMLSHAIAMAGQSSQKKPSATVRPAGVNRRPRPALLHRLNVLTLVRWLLGVFVTALLAISTLKGAGWSLAAIDLRFAVLISSLVAVGVVAVKLYRATVRLTTAATSSAFPFIVCSTTSVVRRLPQFAGGDIPYVPRLSPMKQDALALELDRSQYLLVFGRTGLGKTREVIESLKRFEERLGEEISILIPDGALTSPIEVPTDLLKRDVVLLLDNLRFVAFTPADVNDPQLLEAEWRDRLVQTIRTFTLLYGGRFRVIVTSTGDPDMRAALRRNAPAWSSFHILNLPELAMPQRAAFILSVAAHLNLEVEGDAATVLATKSDGTYSGLIVPLLAARNRRRVDAKDAARMECRYPQNWDDSIYVDLTKRHPARRRIFEALDLVRKSQMAPYEFLVIEIAARLLGQEFLFWQRLRARKALGELTDWIGRSPDGQLACPDAYMQDRGDLPATVDRVMWALEAVTKRREQFRHLVPSLYGFTNALQYELDDLQRATRVLQILLAWNPDNPKALVRKALLDLGNGDHVAAAEACQRSIDISDHPSGYLTLGVVHASSGNFAEAIRAFRSSIQRDDTRAASWSRLGVALSKAGKQSDAISAGLKAITLDPDNPYVYVGLGISYDMGGRLTEAIDVFKRAISLDASNVAAHFALAVSYSRARQPLRAFRTCRSALRIAPLSVTAWSILGRVLEQAHRLKAARRAFEIALDYRPNDGATLLNYGVLLSRLKLRPQATAVLRRLVELSPESVEGLQALARAAIDSHDSDEAVSACLRAVALRPKKVSAWLALATANSAAGNLRGALDAARTATRLEPTSIKAWRTAAFYELKLNDYEGLVQSRLRLSELMPTDASAHRKLAHAYRMMRLPDKQIESLKKSLELDSDNAEAWRVLGAALDASGKQREALNAAKRRCELLRNDASAYWILGIAYGRNGLWREQVGALRRALELDPSLTVAKDALSYVQSVRGQDHRLSNLSVDEALPITIASVVVAWDRHSSEEAFDALEHLVHSVGGTILSGDVGSWIPKALDGWAAFKNGDYFLASTCLREATEADSTVRGVWWLLTSSYRRSGNLEGAVQCAERLTTLIPESYDAWHVFSLRLADIGRLQEAKTATRTAEEVRAAAEGNKKVASPNR